MSTLLYNPDKKNKQQFIEEFVVRTAVFETIFKDIQTSRLKYPEQHYLILGQRGSGKTTLLNRLKYAIEDDSKLKQQLIPVIFNEEQYHIIELTNLWENIAVYLEDFYGFEGITQEIEKHISNKDFETLAFDILIKHLDKHKKKLVLFIDNIGDLFKKFDELEIRRLREILQTKPHIRLIAGSPVMLESILDYQQPLFEFFKVIQLKGLTNEETVILLRKLAAMHHEEKRIEGIIKKTPFRIETLRTLSGGVPRTVALLFRVFIDDEHGNALTDLEKVLDMVTPLYKHRMDDLPTQQQKIVDAVAKNWEAVSVKELSETLRMESKIISAQLRQLEKNQVIEKRATDTKNHIYLLKERFFNIWYLMRYGRKQDKQRVIWLVKFLEMWCDGKEIERRILNYADKSKRGLMDEKTRELYGEAYSFFNRIKPETRMVLREAAPEYLSKHIQLTDEESRKLLVKYLVEKDWIKSIEILTGIKVLDEKLKNEIADLWIGDEHFLNATHKKLSSFIIESKSDEIDWPHFYLLYLFYIPIVRSIGTSDPITFSDNFKVGNKMYRRFLELNMVSEFENTNFSLCIFNGLRLKQYNVILYSLAEEFKGIEIRNNALTVLLVITQFFAGNEDVSYLNKFGSEIQATVLKLIDSIKKKQSDLV